MTNEIMKLVDAYKHADVILTANERKQQADAARAALEQALQAQAAEIERLQADLTVAKVERDSAHENVGDLRAEIERLTAQLDQEAIARENVSAMRRELAAKLDAATKVPLSADVLNSLWGDAVVLGDPTAGNLHIRYARAVEASHNIKGTTP